MKKSIMSSAVAIIALVAFSAFSPAPASTDHEHPLLLSEAIGGAHLVFAGKNGGNISKNEMRGQTELSVEGCAKGSKIFTYVLEINSGGKTRTLEAKSNKLTSEMVTALQAMKTGETFQFKSMKAQLPDGKDIVDVSSSKFTVV